GAGSDRRDGVFSNFTFYAPSIDIHGPLTHTHESQLISIRGFQCRNNLLRETVTPTPIPNDKLWLISSIDRRCTCFVSFHPFSDPIQIQTVQFGNNFRRTSLSTSWTDIPFVMRPAVCW